LVRRLLAEGASKHQSHRLEDYMTGLVALAQPGVPGSADVIGSLGDERNALLLVTAKLAGGPFGEGATRAGVRLYLVDDEGKIKAEQVIFYATPD